ncbi:MAG: 1-(5-phosphoribosyl)-5-[(5-phosphoribosylamino)methylideneamino]imidazole-4-carboxamide isomerase [SAR202 cluster bacterium Io17-Chloro-G7]|nr:MAG: 1-(5-phosphoribosyl)-5-[(5-phosphoribosylamino)methylideneamino]imidazole-4-carboxamide isomerase [SAR202 cluster bacterium Io17-Chloro-G7]
MEVIPSIDLKTGRCVRLYQGDFGKETVYSDDPVSVALSWQEQGGLRLHLVDLDGATQGRLVNLGLIAEIVKQLTIPVQVGGGIRSLETAKSLLSSGADRVVVGTAAVENPEMVEALCREHGSQCMVVAVDARDGQVAIKGWTQQSTVSVFELAHQMSDLGVIRLLYTDISRDGTMTEPNFAANEALVRGTGMAVLASGGVTVLEHIGRLAETGAEGAIVGRALYDRAFTLPDAIAVARKASG